jgi:hypothetical protein
MFFEVEFDPNNSGVGDGGRNITERKPSPNCLFLCRAGKEGIFYNRAKASWGVCTENLIRVDDVMESPKLAE